MLKNLRTLVTMLAVISVSLVVALPEASAGGTPVETADNVSAYTIDATTGALTAVIGSPFAAGTGPFSVVTLGLIR